MPRKQGGKIRPDGRSPQTPGVGKSAKRHDLERPATPGLSNSDLQQGDVQRLEQAQAISPRAGAKQVQGQAGGGQRSGAATQQRAAGIQAPDPMEFASQRLKGTLGQEGPGLDTFPVEAWKPLLQQLAADPSVSGPLTHALIAQLGNLSRLPSSNRIEVIDQNGLDDALGVALGVE